MKTELLFAALAALALLPSTASAHQLHGTYEQAASAACAPATTTPPPPTTTTPPPPPATTTPPPPTTTTPPPPAPGAREEGVVFSGTTLLFYPKESAELCQSDCENTPECQGTTWIQAGTYNPGDAAMCYLISSVTGRSPARGHISAMKRGAAPDGSTTPPSQQPDSATGKTRAINEQVSVLYGSSWWPATVIEKVAGTPEKLKIHYDGWGSSWDEWVTPDRIRDR